jgi:hypothetical protein
LLEESINCSVAQRYERAFGLLPDNRIWITQPIHEGICIRDSGEFQMQVLSRACLGALFGLERLRSGFLS